MLKSFSQTEHEAAEASLEENPQGKSAQKRTRRFSVRLVGAFALTALMTAAIAGIILGIVWNQQFERYRRDNINHTASSLASIISTNYIRTGGWTYDALAPAAQYWNEPNTGVRIVDMQGKVLADSTVAEDESAQGNGDGTPNTQEQNKAETIFEQAVKGRLAPEYYTAQAPIVLPDGTQIGTVNMWVYGKNTLLSTKDLEFRTKSYQAIGFATIITVIIASLAGAIFSRQLVRPINKITDTARRIRSGDESARTELTSDDEIGELGRTFDDMATAIEQDRELERRLTSDVAHELRTPLMAIQATVEAMQDGVLPADEEHLYRVSNETVRLSRLVDAILELTRLERGSLPFTMARLDLSELMNETVYAHEALFDSCQIELSAQIDPGIEVWGDPDRLRQAVGNLLSNAARYTPEGGKVAVRLSKNAGNAVIEVEDTGIGIEEENLRRVFSRFWRADGARNRSQGGLGIGLSVTKEIVDRHKGAIHVLSPNMKGTNFTIVLPLYREDRKDRQKRVSLKGEDRKAKTKRTA